MTISSTPALITLVPHTKLSWRSFAFSYGVQTVAVALLLELGIFFPHQLIPAKQYLIVKLTDPPPNRRDPGPPPKSTAVTRIERPVAAIRTPAPLLTSRVSATELITPPKAAHVELVTPVVSAPRPVIVKTGAFSTGSSAPPTVNLSARKVQTGGFGDSNGVPGDGKPGAKLMIASAGSFDLPSGPGQGNGIGGDRGVRSTVASAGFGNGVVTGTGNGRGGNGRGTIQQGGFGDSRPVVGASLVHAAPAVQASTPVEIVSKPKPVYTEEARQLRLEGEVLLEVTFTAAGEVRVGRVIRGLGHGLDEAAVRAAQQIRFRPAKQDGHPADFTAALHVVFQMAY